MSESRKKQPWVAPTLSAHGGGLNKFGATRRNLVTERIGGIPVEELAQRFGSPLFVIEERRLREERHYDSLDALRAQIALDARQAREFFAAAG